MTGLEALKLRQKIERTVLGLKHAVQRAEFSRKEEMADVNQEIEDFLTQMDAATTAVASRIEAILAGVSLTPETRARLATELADLRALAADPTNPVPPPSNPSV